MRTFFLGLFLALFLIIGSPLFLVEFIINKFNPKLRVRSSYYIVRFVIKIVLKIAGANYTVIGAENIPNDQAYLYVGNHKSYFDIVLALATTPTFAGFVAKKSMEKIPFLSRWMKNIDCLFLDRDNIKEGLKTILQGIDYIKNGYSMFICPEGTRNPEEEMLEFREGGLKLATKTGCPIIPVAFTNTDALFEKHGNRIRKANVVVEYGAPIYLDKLTSEEKKFIGSYTRQMIQKMLDKNKGMVL